MSTRCQASRLQDAALGCPFPPSPLHRIPPVLLSCWVTWELHPSAGAPYPNGEAASLPYSSIGWLLCGSNPPDPHSPAVTPGTGSELWALVLGHAQTSIDCAGGGWLFLWQCCRLLGFCSWMCRGWGEWWLEGAFPCTLPRPQALYPPAGGGCIPFPTRICWLLGGSRLSLQVKLLCTQTKGWGCGCLPLFSVLVHPAPPAEAPPCMALGWMEWKKYATRSPVLCCPFEEGAAPPIPSSLDAVRPRDGGGGWIWGGLLQLSCTVSLGVCQRGA